MKKTLLATAIAMGLGVSGAAWADIGNTASGAGDKTQTNTSTITNTTTTTDTNTSSRTSTRSTDNSNQNNDQSQGSNRDNSGWAHAEGYGTAAANNGGTAVSTFSNSFNSSKAIAISRLDGTVSNLSISGIGNVATNTGTANGGSGGRGG
ncbi:signal peptide protein, partial [Ralstonia solanacearum]